MNTQNNQKGAETSIGEECSCRGCKNKAVIKAHYLPLENELEDPRSLCNDCYESADEDTGRKYYQSNLDRVEML